MTAAMTHTDDIKIPNMSSLDLACTMHGDHYFLATNTPQLLHRAMMAVHWSALVASLRRFACP